MSFGDRLRQFREEAGISQRELNRRTGLSSSYIHYVEKDRVRPSDTSLSKIARALSISAKALQDERDRVEFEERGIDGEVSLKLKGLGNLTDEEQAAILNAASRVETARKRKQGKAARAR